MADEKTKSNVEQLDENEAEESVSEQPVVEDEPKETTAVEKESVNGIPEPAQLPEEIIVDLDEVPRDDTYSAEQIADMEAKYAETMKIFRSGELVTGKIVAITESDVAVDIGFKSEGSIPIEEFDDRDDLKVGREVEVLIDNIENEEGTLALSKKKAEFTRVWEKINHLYQTGEMVEAPIVKRIKGGMVVDLFGVEAFLPGSQIDVHPVRDFDALVNVTMDFRIIKVNNARKNVVLSHKVLVEESLREIREKVLAEIEEGQVVEGVVKNITDFGVFVDLGGVDGLLHITDLSWGRVSHPSDVVKLDEKIMTKVLRYDKEKQRISLGLKQLKEHHWDEIEEKYPLGSKIKGKVVSLVKYGAFVELEEGVEGLVHISEMSWTQHIKHPSQMVNVGDEIDVVVLNIDRENRKISLGMKQCEEDPWERLEQVFKPGTTHKGIVRDLVPFGAFVELEPNIDGLIHISDLSWVRKVRHPGEIVKKGDEIEVKVLSFDRNERRIALGYKQLEPDPWNGFEKEYPIRSHSEGSVVRVLEKGVVVMLPLGVEGFVPNSQLGKSLYGENKKKIKEGDNLELEVIEFDKVNHRIVLSHSLVEKGREKTSAYRTYKGTSSEVKTTLGDIMRESIKKSVKKDLGVTVEKPETVIDHKAEQEISQPTVEEVEVILEKPVDADGSETVDATDKTAEAPAEVEVVDAEIVTKPAEVEPAGEQEESAEIKESDKTPPEKPEAPADLKESDTSEAEVKEKVEAPDDAEEPVPPADEKKAAVEKDEVEPKVKSETKPKAPKPRAKKKTAAAEDKPKPKTRKKPKADQDEEKAATEAAKPKARTQKKKVEKDDKTENKPKVVKKARESKGKDSKTKKEEE